MTATPADASVADWVTPELITTDPRHVADELRRTAPVAAVPFTGGLMLSSFGLIKEFLGDYTRYTAVDADGGTTDRAVGPSHMRQDGPEHTRQRRQIMQSLRPRAVEQAWGKVFARYAAKRSELMI